MGSASSKSLISPSSKSSKNQNTRHSNHTSSSPSRLPIYTQDEIKEFPINEDLSHVASSITSITSPSISATSPSSTSPPKTPDTPYNIANDIIYPSYIEKFLQEDGNDNDHAVENNFNEKNNFSNDYSNDIFMNSFNRPTSNSIRFSSNSNRPTLHIIPIIATQTQNRELESKCSSPRDDVDYSFPIVSSDESPQKSTGFHIEHVKIDNHISPDTMSIDSVSSISLKSKDPSIPSPSCSIKSPSSSLSLVNPDITSPCSDADVLRRLAVVNATGESVRHARSLNQTKTHPNASEFRPRHNSQPTSMITKSTTTSTTPSIHCLSRNLSQVKLRPLTTIPAGDQVHSGVGIHSKRPASSHSLSSRASRSNSPTGSLNSRQSESARSSISRSSQYIPTYYPSKPPSLSESIISDKSHPSRSHYQNPSPIGVVGTGYTSPRPASSKSSRGSSMHYEDNKSITTGEKVESLRQSTLTPKSIYTYSMASKSSPVLTDNVFPGPSGMISNAPLHHCASFGNIAELDDESSGDELELHTERHRLEEPSILLKQPTLPDVDLPSEDELNDKIGYEEKLKARRTAVLEGLVEGGMASPIDALGFPIESISSSLSKSKKKPEKRKLSKKHIPEKDQKQMLIQQRRRILQEQRKLVALTASDPRNSSLIGLEPGAGTHRASVVPWVNGNNNTSEFLPHLLYGSGNHGIGDGRNFGYQAGVDAAKLGFITDGITMSSAFSEQIYTETTTRSRTTTMTTVYSSNSTRHSRARGSIVTSLEEVASTLRVPRGFDGDRIVADEENRMRCEAEVQEMLRMERRDIAGVINSDVVH